MMSFPFAKDDEELLGFLRSRIAECVAGAASHPASLGPFVELIPTVDLYATEPWNVMEALAAIAAETGTPAVQRDEVVFFSPRSKLGKHPVRTAGRGTWLGSPACKIYKREEVIGEKMLLRFQHGCLDEVEAGGGLDGEDCPVVGASAKKRKRDHAEEITKEYLLYEYTLKDSSDSDIQDLVICRMNIMRQGDAITEESEAADLTAKKARKDIWLGYSPAASTSTVPCHPEQQHPVAAPSATESIDEPRSSTESMDEPSSSSSYREFSDGIYPIHHLGSGEAGADEEFLQGLVTLTDEQLEAAMEVAAKAASLDTLRDHTQIMVYASGRPSLPSLLSVSRGVFPGESTPDASSTMGVDQNGSSSSCETTDGTCSIDYVAETGACTPAHIYESLDEELGEALLTLADDQPPALVEHFEIQNQMAAGARGVQGHANANSAGGPKSC